MIIYLSIYLSTEYVFNDIQNERETTLERLKKITKIKKNPRANDHMRSRGARSYLVCNDSTFTSRPISASERESSGAVR